MFYEQILHKTSSKYSTTVGRVVSTCTKRRRSSNILVFVSKICHSSCIVDIAHCGNNKL